MLKIRALNRESSSDEDVPVIRREAQEEIALELYNQALRLQGKSEYEESESILLKLIEENIPLLENNGGLPKSMSTLKYSCFINLGNIYLKEEKVNKALESYLTASDLDATDVTLWFKIGKLSLKADKFKQSAYAFSKGLECSESHWPCLDNLISVLFAIKDTVACLVYIGKALMLDADYLKGLVLRKQIYRDNPATKDYYQLYNPDYIWEPPLDISIDEADEEQILEEAQFLCNRVIEVEKSYGPKPLPTIALPKPLEDFSWICLAKTITYLHQYITDNEMSHFTMIDISKCMSQPSDIISKSPSTEAEDQLHEVKCEKMAEENCEENPVDPAPIENEEKMDSEPIPERRFSQNSETNNDGQENTPIQTDNDEEQNMDQDNEDPDDNSELKADRGRPRGSKRKRDVLSELQIWGWHSKRKPPKKVKHRDFTVEDALNRIIPKTLLPVKIDAEKFNQMEDSMNTMDIYNLYMEDHNVNYLSPIHSPKSVNYEAYFGTDREKDAVSEFWLKKRDYCDSVVLVKDLVFTLSKLWHYKWPKELVPLYIEAYNMFREHCDQPQVYCGGLTFQQIRNDALATLLYGELLSFSSESKEVVHPTYLGYLQTVSGWQEEWQEEYASFFNRVLWLRSHLFRKENAIDLAIRSLQLMQEVIDEEEAKSKEKYLLSLPNCFRYGLITNQITEKILKHLDMINSLGTVENLFNCEKYVEVAEILKQTFINSGSHCQVGRMGRPAQLGLLLHSLWFTDLTECFIWSEECLFESLDHYLKSRKDADKWEKIVEKCLAICHEIIKKETVSVIDSLTEDKRCRLVESLCKIISKQLNTENQVKIPLGCVTPWILLHYILVREEHRQYASKRNNQAKRDKTETGNINHDTLEDELPPSIAILFSAHEFLGPKSWCLTGQGELLHFILDTVLDRLDAPIFERLREKIDIHIEQALFCLYQHPSKKNKVSRHLADHNVDPLPLIWERAFQLFEFYGPDCLPEFNSYKNASISADLEQLLKRIIALVPSESAPQHHLSKIMDFIHGNTDTCPDAIEFPNKVRSIYYLIGDFYFKQREFTRSVKYFQMDLCINPARLDSWACLGLSYAAQLDSKLNHCQKFKTEMEFLDKAKYASICFKKALTIAPDHLILWIEYGTFQYTAHSYCSRILKYESENLSMEKFEFLENQKNSYLDSSGSSFEKAIALYEMEDNNEPDERWLQYYILGKIAEKKQKEPTEYLQYYVTASTLLDENRAIYPDKIFYNAPQHLAVEALELHYRIHASVLKYLELHEGKEIPTSLGTFFKKCLSSSKFFKKPSKDIAEVPTKVSESSGLSFQEQFLISLNKMNEESNKLVEEEKPESEIKAVADNLEKSLPKNTDVLPVQDNITKEIPQPLPKASVEEDDVIMISDSDDEKCDTNNTNTEIKKDEENKSEDSNPKPVKDVQQMLDEMMVKTMMEVEEQPNEVDSDLSGTEKIEEVVCKEEKGTQNEIKHGKIDNNNKSDKSAKVKPSDSETDTDNIRTSVDDDSSSSSSSSSTTSSSSDSDSDDDSSSSSSSSSSGTSGENMSNSEILQLVDRCVAGLEICIIRLSQNYKALYRLAHLFFHYKAKKDLTKCKQLLLGEYKCKDDTIVAGLFSDRKINNFFNGIWRIPSTEIDRPGSLSAHMSRCVSLLLQVLRNTNDNKILIDLCMQLRRTPDADKIYIKDSERMAFSEQALTMCTQTLRGQIRNISKMTNPQIVKLLQEIFRIHQRIQKNFPTQENVFSSMLVDVYKQFIKEKIPENVNILDLAIKFCQQNKTVEKNKVQIQNPLPPMPRGPGIATPPVLPPPSKVTPTPTLPLKRPGAGRPRGRPPLPKIPGQVRQPRGKSPSAGGASKSYAWQKSLFDQSYAYEYLKHYQDELIKQYSQNLNLNQLTQLSQVLAQGQLNPLTASAITNQFLAQTGLLSPNNLLKQMGPATTTTGVNQPLPSQLMEGLNQVNPNPKKKIGVEQALSSLTPEQLKYIGSMLPSASKAPSITKTNYPHTFVSSASSIPSKTKQSTTSLKSTASTSKPNIAEPASKLNKLDSTMSNLSSSGQIFKEPSLTKTPSADEKTSKGLMKDRPNISITPVTGSLPPPMTSTASFPRSVITTTVSTSFTRPSVATSPSSGKTLQEKLAEKKKEQFNKQLQQKTVETEKYSSEALLKSLNIPNIPSSLTVSKASLPVSPPGYSALAPAKINPILPKSIPKSIQNLSSTSPSSLPPYPVDLGRAAATVTASKSVLPPNLTVSKSTIPLQTPKFPLESGISISQIPVKSPKTHEKKNFSHKTFPSSKVTKSAQFTADSSMRSNEKAITSTPKKDITTNVLKSFPSLMSVDITPVTNKVDKFTSKKFHKSNFLSNPSKSVGLPKKSGQKPPTHKTHTDFDLNNPTGRNPITGLSEKTGKHASSTASCPSAVNTTKIRDPRLGKKESFNVNASNKNTTPSKNLSSKESSDDDIICID